MLDNLDIEKVLFLDIETVPQEYKFSELNPEVQKLWDQKSAYFQKDELTAADVYERAGIYAEFGKIVCISVGFIAQRQGERIVKLKSFANDDEKVLLKEFCDLLNSYYNHNGYLLCGHNGKEFDFPYIARRLLINGMKLPLLLDIAGKKPWEVAHLDTMELWKFGDYKAFTSLNLLAHVFGIPTPKDDISGADVARVYYEENNLDRISTYCQKDVLTLIQVLLKFKGEALLEEHQVVYV
jgi:uncharacterized protein YprB with RNaseH-like and TPR domain